MLSRIIGAAASAAVLIGGGIACAATNAPLPVLPAQGTPVQTVMAGQGGHVAIPSAPTDNAPYAFTGERRAQFPAISGVYQNWGQSTQFIPPVPGR